MPIDDLSSWVSDGPIFDAAKEVLEASANLNSLAGRTLNLVGIDQKARHMANTDLQKIAYSKALKKYNDLLSAIEND